MDILWQCLETRLVWVWQPACSSSQPCIHPRSWIRMGYDWSASGGRESAAPVKKNSVSRSEKVRILSSFGTPKLSSCSLSCTCCMACSLHVVFVQTITCALPYQHLLGLPRFTCTAVWLADWPAHVCCHKHWAYGEPQGFEGEHKRESDIWVAIIAGHPPGLR